MQLVTMKNGVERAIKAILFFFTYWPYKSVLFDSFCRKQEQKQTEFNGCYLILRSMDVNLVWKRITGAELLTRENGLTLITQLFNERFWDLFFLLMREPLQLVINKSFFALVKWCFIVYSENLKWWI